MLVNPNHTELINKEIRKIRREESDQWRLIRDMKTEVPPIPFKIRGIVLSYWHTFWSKLTKKRKYIPISQTPKKSTSL